MILYQFTISGQCPSGKNAIIVTRTGHRFPNQRFVDWRNHALTEIFQQIKIKEVIDYPISVDIKYMAGDRIRRDMPGIIDALWHVIEKAGIVSDDTYLGGHGQTLSVCHLGLDRGNSGVEITLFNNGVNHESKLSVCKKQPKTRKEKKLRRTTFLCDGNRRKKTLVSCNIRCNSKTGQSRRVSSCR